MRRRASSALATIRAREAFSSVWAPAFAIAVATSSVKSASRYSVSGGAGLSWTEPTAMTPHSSPSTMIGTPTADRIRTNPVRAGGGALSSSYSSRSGRCV
jgi:hypothetical protein